MLVGLSTAKAIAAARRLPLVPVDHLHGHVAANFLEPEPLEPPFVCLVASGGHTLLAAVRERTGYEVLGQTLDDAASRVWPPLANRQTNGGSSGSGSRKLAATWPCRWSTGTSGRRRAAAIAFAVLSPTSSAPIRPGPRSHRHGVDVLEPAPASRSAASDHPHGELEVLA